MLAGISAGRAQPVPAAGAVGTSRTAPGTKPAESASGPSPAKAAMVPIARIILTFEAADPPVHAPNRLIFNLKTAKALAVHTAGAWIETSACGRYRCRKDTVRLNFHKRQLDRP